MAAATAMLDETFPPLPNRKDDHNKYILGRVGQHTIVITCLPAGIYGTTSATATAFHMRYSFESIDVCFMVGIGGGAPGKHDIRLGDIVVSEPFGRYGGVVHYDRGKIVDGGRTMLTGALGKPPDAVLRTLCALKAHHFHTISQVLEYYHEALQRLPLLQETMPYPGTDTDQLFFSGYPHVFPYSDCHMCDQSKIKQRAARPDTRPRVFYGLIASGDKVIKDATTRDQLAQEHDILCFETEAAGLMDIFPCLVVRGICDYADSHKNKQWQGYAAAVAAAYTKELLLFLPYYETPPPVTATDGDRCISPGQSAVQVSKANFTPTFPALNIPSPVVDQVELAPTVLSQTSAPISQPPAPVIDRRNAQLDSSCTRITRTDTTQPSTSPRPLSPTLLIHSLQGDDSDNVILKIAPLVLPASDKNFPLETAGKIDEALKIQLAIARRKGTWRPWPGDSERLLFKIQWWIQDPTIPKALILRPQPRADPRASDLTAELIDHLLAYNAAEGQQDGRYEVLWQLKSREVTAETNPYDLLRLLVYCALQPNPTLFESHKPWPPNMPYQTLWAKFGVILTRLKRVYIVIQSVNFDFTRKILHLAKEVAAGVFPGVKILVVLESTDRYIQDPGLENWQLMDIQPPPPKSGSKGSQYYRGVAWEAFRPGS